jgi:SAM-dependent methyltransferase
MGFMVNVADRSTSIESGWHKGDYARVAEYLKPGAIEILEGWKIPPGARMLDVACGAGQISIPAARKGIQVTGIDIAENLIEKARRQAAAEDLAIRFDLGSASQLPYPDASFDFVTSLMGVIFAQKPTLTASELIRVVRPGGRILLANWTPESLEGQAFKLISEYTPPRYGEPSPFQWGDEAIVHERLWRGLRELRMTRRLYPHMEYPFGVAKFVTFNRRYNPPIRRAFSRLSREERLSLQCELIDLYRQYDRCHDGKACFEAEYLEVIGVRD